MGTLRAQEWKAAGRLAGHALGGAVGVVAGMHHAFTKRVESLLPPPARPIMRAHTTIASAVYHSVAGAHRVVPAAAGHVIALTGDRHGPAPSSSRYGRIALPAVNGIWGDTVAALEPALAVRMAVRSRGEDVPVDRDALRRVFPGATGQIVVFTHGLSENDAAWFRSRDAHRPYGEQLRDDHGFTPVYLRFNSGMRISDNGGSLARLMEQLTDAWPVQVRRIVLVGHSMGGLIARSACHYGDRHGESWVDLVDTAITLGTPHLGAPLEKGVHVADWLLSRLPETAPLGRMLGLRSVGVKDLRFGHVVEEDWRGHDADEFLRDRSTAVPFLAHAAYYFVAATLTRDLRHPVGRLLGDGMVRYPSAAGTGRAKRIGFEIDHGTHVGGLGHLGLLNHPAVYQQMAAWIARAAPVSA